MRTAATSGLWDGTSAGAALPGWRALILAVGETRLAFLGVASGSCRLRLGNQVCAPPLLKRIVVVGGALAMLQRGRPFGSMEGTRGGMVGRSLHRGVLAALSPVCSGREGGLASPGDRPIAITESQPQGDASTEPAHLHALSCVVVHQLKWSYQSHF